MSIEMVGLVLAGAMVLLIAIGLPVAFAIILASFAVIFLQGHINPVIAAQRIYSGMDSFSLMAIPFFLLAGSIMVAGGLSRRLIDFANALVGRFTGGLAISNVMSSIMFGGVSGSAVADTSAMGRTYIPAMVQAGYDRKFSIGLTAASSPISPLIPPSIAWIVYAFITDQSVIRMFIAGVVPGLFWALALMMTAYYIAKKRNYPTSAPATIKEIGVAFWKALPAIMMPVIILVGIRMGVFTVTEASVLAVIYSLVISTLVYRDMSLRSLIDAVRSSVRMTASVMIILAAAALFAWILSSHHIPNTLAGWMQETVRSPLLFLLMINVLLLFIGTFMEVNAAKVMLLPVLFPIAVGLGIDPIHFGVIITVNLCLGLITPPIGIVLALASKIGGVSIEEGTRGVTVFFIVGLVVLAVLTLVPVLSTGLPDLVLGVQGR
ncbi:TRAP transporter large permease [Halomonas sp. BM-2019]|uniref:TRAP transporter large permease n=1 Tax=Halomonas sp. BM-2019 TaxID=2811227 RepID=UPI001B3C225F|nr:MAG: TRAP transporter large permease [Halomonas sp. BM-2019]